MGIRYLVYHSRGKSWTTTFSLIHKAFFYRMGCVASSDLICLSGSGLWCGLMFYASCIFPFQYTQDLSRRGFHIVESPGHCVWHETTGLLYFRKIFHNQQRKANRSRHLATDTQAIKYHRKSIKMPLEFAISLIVGHLAVLLCVWLYLDNQD